ncbi:hypothetical protein H5410_041510 [Solanum commersonii]|uniref:Uncharacterized protein n=1 Tax=Solanum commersonii TaxID=4109 RepID=A0A9J5XUR7_SOLCO|nr:hypothetical protein H5410_041510 [Solanum commersonii]
MAEVKNFLLERRKLISSPTTISDLKQEINNLKEDIHRLIEKNVTIEITLDNIESDETFMASALKEGKRKNMSWMSLEDVIPLLLGDPLKASSMLTYKLLHVGH